MLLVTVRASTSMTSSVQGLYAVYVPGAEGSSSAQPTVTSSGTTSNTGKQRLQG